jgi:hypothetical protein
MPHADLDSVRRDASLAIAYARSAGLLPNDSLPRTLATLEGLPKDQAPSPEQIAALNIALNDVIKIIAPITLVDLREGRSPFDATGQRRGARAQIGLSLFCVLLTFAVAFFTQLLNQQTVAAKALYDIQRSQPLDDLHKAERLAQALAQSQTNDQIGIGSDTDMDAYHKLIDDLSAASDHISAAYELARAMNAKASRFLGTMVTAFDSTYMPWSSAATGPTAPASRDAMPAVSVDHTKLIQDRSNLPSYDSFVASQQPPLVVKSASWSELPLAFRVQEGQFLQKTGLGYYVLAANKTSSLTYSLEAYISFLKSWLLPLLYGLLGASVYCMRNLLNPRTANTSLVGIIFRISLGGIAGIAIGWLSLPSGPGQDVSVTMAPFLIAFLAGFSIDALFAILERATRSLIGVAEGRPEAGRSTA